jgi:hypothetical protein
MENRVKYKYLTLSLWWVLMFERLLLYTRFAQDDLPCYIIRTDIREVVIVVEREYIGCLVYASMITVEDSYLIVREEGYIEDAVLTRDRIPREKRKSLPALRYSLSKGSYRDSRYKLKNPSDTRLIEGEWFGMIDELIGKQNNNC